MKKTGTSARFRFYWIIAFCTSAEARALKAFSPAFFSKKAGLRRIAKPEENYAIIYVEENLAKELWSDINRYKDAPTPAIILIPGRDGTLGLGQSALQEAVERAVGSNIL